MLRKLAMRLFAADGAGGGGGGAAVDEAVPDHAVPRSMTRNWIKKLGPLEQGTQDEPVAETLEKEGEKEDGENSAAGRSDQDGAGKGVHVDDSGTAGQSKVAGKADKKAGEAGKAAAKTKEEVVLPPEDGEKGTEGKGKDADDVEVVPTEGDDAPAPKSNKDWEKWKAKRAERETELRGQIKTATDRVTELTNKIAEFEKKSGETAVDPALKARLDQVEALNKQLSEALERENVENHPKFKEFYGSKVKDVHDDIKSILGDDVGKQFIDLLALPESEYKKTQMAELYSSMEESQKTQIGAAQMQLRQIERDRKKDVEDSRAKNEQLREQQKTKAAELEKVWINEAESQMKALEDPKNGFSAFQKREGDSEAIKSWNASVDQRKAQVRDYLTGKDTSPKAVVSAAIAAAQLPIFQKLYQRDSAAWKKEKSELEATIKRLSAAQPNGGRGEGGEKDRKPNPVHQTGIPPLQRSKNWAKMIANDMNGGG